MLPQVAAQPAMPQPNSPLSRSPAETFPSLICAFRFPLRLLLFRPMLSLQLGSRSASTGPLGRVFFSLFFFIFLGIGTVIFCLIARDVGKRAETYRWTQVPCVIRSSRIVTDHNSENPY